MLYIETGKLRKLYRYHYTSFYYYIPLPVNNIIVNYTKYKIQNTKPTPCPYLPN